MRLRRFYLPAIFVLSCAHPSKAHTLVGKQEIAHVLDDWHAAAAASDQQRYFSHFTSGGVFFGTDPGERWRVDEFRAYARPHFAKGKAWSFRATRRAVFLSVDGRTAWFDEDLDTPNLGPSRGTGVLVRGDDARWRIAQYNLSVPIPNGVFEEVKGIISAPESPKTEIPHLKE